jgi:hypothetical protein
MRVVRVLHAVMCDYNATLGVGRWSSSAALSTIPHLFLKMDCMHGKIQTHSQVRCSLSESIHTLAAMARLAWTSWQLTNEKNTGSSVCHGNKHHARAHCKSCPHIFSTRRATTQPTRQVIGRATRQAIGRASKTRTQAIKACNLSPRNEYHYFARSSPSQHGVCIATLAIQAC